MKNYTTHGVRWKSKTQYVNETTGEELTKYQTEKKTNGKKDYLMTGIDKHITFNYNKTLATIHWTKKYCKNPQLKLL